MTVVLRTVARVVVPLGVVVSFAYFLQGHDLPGGGFVAGVLTASVLALAYLAYGLDGVERDVFGRERAPPDDGLDHGTLGAYESVAAAGLGLAVAVGIGAVAYGYLTGTPVPFMTQTHVELSVPLFGHVGVASATAFDLGVYAVVVGALLTIVSAVGSE